MRPLQYQLENGLTVILRPTHSAPVVACSVWVGVGSADETSEQAGLAHLLEHMLFKGNTKQTVGEIASRVEAYGGHINAFTTLDYTCFYVVQSSRRFEQVMLLLADMILFSPFDEDEIRRAIEVIQHEIKTNSESPEILVSERLFSTAYHDHPYRNPVIGTSETIALFTRDDVFDFYKAHYVPSNTTVVITGDFELEEAKGIVKKVFGGFHGSFYQFHSRPHEVEQASLRASVLEKEVSENHFSAAFHIPNIYHQDIPALILLATYLGMGESSHLHHRLHREQGLFRSVDVSCTNPKDFGLLVVSTKYALESGEITHEQPLYALFKELFECRTRKISEHSLERAKTLFESRETYGKQTVQGLAMRFGMYHQLTGDPMYEALLAGSLANIDVEDLRRVAKTYLQPNRCSVVLLRSHLSPEMSERELARIIREASSNEERFAYETSEQIFFSLHGEPGDILSCRLPNDIRLVVQEDHSVEAYSMYALNLGGTRYETPQTAGIGALAAELITSGTSIRNAHEIASFMESNASFLNGTSGFNTFGLQLTGLSRFYEKNLECFVDCWLNYSIPEREFDFYRKEQLRSILVRQDDLVARTFDAMRGELFANHPYRWPKIGTSDSVHSLTSDTLLKTMPNLARSESMVLCVVGDVDADHVAEMAAQQFSCSDTPFSPPKVSKPIFRQTPALVTNHLNKEQACLVVGFQAPIYGAPLRYAGAVLLAVLSGQGGRLSLALRDQLAFAHDVSATGRTGLDASYFSLNLSTSPDNVELALTALYDQILRLHHDGIRQDEIQRAKRYLIGNHDIGLQRTTSRTVAYGLEELYGAGFKEVMRFADHINAVTQDDLSSFIHSFLNLNTSVTSITTPEYVVLPSDIHLLTIQKLDRSSS